MDKLNMHYLIIYSNYLVEIFSQYINGRGGPLHLYHSRLEICPLELNLDLILNTNSSYGFQDSACDFKWLQL